MTRDMITARRRTSWPTMASAFLLAAVALLVGSPTHAAAAAPAPAAACDASVLQDCPVADLIPFAEFTATFPVIEYCLSPDQGFVPVEKEACTRHNVGDWTVRPDWAASEASLEDQYTCRVCAALAEAKAQTEEGKGAVWILTLSSRTTYYPEDFQGWGQQLGVRLDQLIVSPSNRRYLFAFAGAKAVADLLAGSSFVLAAQPMPSELKVSPRVADPASLQAITGGGDAAATAGTGGGEGTMSTGLAAPSASPDGAAAAPAEGAAAPAAEVPTTTLHIRTLVGSDLEGAPASARAARRREGMLRIRAALGLPPPVGETMTPEEVGIWTGGAAGTGAAAADDTAGADGHDCADCTVETVGEGTYLVANLPVEAAGQAARNITDALAAALVVDIAVDFQLFNKESAYLIQSGSNSSLGGRTLMWDHGLTGASEVIGVADTGLDHRSCFFQDSRNPVVFKSEYDEELRGYFPVYRSESHRKIREYFAYADAQEGVAGGHGTHVCGSVAGNPAEMAASTKSYQYRGAAYMSKLAFFDIGQPNDAYLYIPPDLSTGFFPRTYYLGGRIHCNSWGSSISTNSEEMYQTDKYLWEHQDFLIVYAAGNEGARGARTVGTPALSKNSVSVGATTNGVVDPDVAYFSSRGPTFDMRLGIDLCAPGYFVYSAYSTPSGQPNQCYILGMAGTSMSAPLVAGTAALLREYFTSGFYPLGWANPQHSMVPMGALLKAVLINSAQEMKGPQARRHNANFNVTYPNIDQGFGVVSMKHATYFQGGDSPNALFVDGAWSEDTAADGSCASCPKVSQGQTVTYTIVPTGTAPVKITLAYYDYPASTAISTRTLVNNLDLTAVVGGTTTLYANGAAQTTADVNIRNNVEQITVAAPVVGRAITIRVAGTSVARGPQPYALAVTGQFRKDAALFPQAVPRVDSVATDGDQALLVGANFPRSKGLSQSFTWACVSNPNITDFGAEVIGYSEAAAFLAVRLSTTACETFSVQITSDGFIGNATTLTYGGANISTLCAEVARDSTCPDLTACAGQCLQGVGDDKQHGLGISLATIIIIIAVGMAVLVGCCCGIFCLRKFCCGPGSRFSWASQRSSGGASAGMAASPPPPPPPIVVVQPSPLRGPRRSAFDDYYAAKARSYGGAPSPSVASVASGSVGAGAFAARSPRAGDRDGIASPPVSPSGTGASML